MRLICLLSDVRECNLTTYLVCGIDRPSLSTRFESNKPKLNPALQSLPRFESTRMGGRKGGYYVVYISTRLHVRKPPIITQKGPNYKTGAV